MVASVTKTGFVINCGNSDGCGVGEGAEDCATAVGASVSSAAISTRHLIPSAEGNAVGDSAVVVGSWLEINAGIGISCQ